MSQLAGSQAPASPSALGHQAVCGVRHLSRPPLIGAPTPQGLAPRAFGHRPSSFPAPGNLTLFRLSPNFCTRSTPASPRPAGAPRSTRRTPPHFGLQTRRPTTPPIVPPTSLQDSQQRSGPRHCPPLNARPTPGSPRLYLHALRQQSSPKLGLRLAPDISAPSQRTHPHPSCTHPYRRPLGRS